MKNKFRSYSFWMSVCAAVVLVINNLAKAFGFCFDNEIFTQIIDSICGVLVVLGILTMTKKQNNQTQDKEDYDMQNNDIIQNDKENQEDTFNKNIEKTKKDMHKDK